MTDVTKDLQRVAIKAKAPILDEITEASGQGALTPVQTPDNLEPIQPRHLTVEDIQSIENKANEFVEKVKTEPSDWQLGNFVFGLGQEIMDQTDRKSVVRERV